MTSSTRRRLAAIGVIGRGQERAAVALGETAVDEHVEDLVREIEHAQEV